jgi:hypothetical protein
MDHITREQEIQQILKYHGQTGAGPVYALMERQFLVISGRAQILIGICGIMITTTGFSGRMIAGTNPVAQVLIMAAMGTVLLAATITVRCLLNLNWLTQIHGDDIEHWLTKALDYRDNKTRLYNIAAIIMTVGLGLYAIAIALMLHNPTGYAVPMNR